MTTRNCKTCHEDLDINMFEATTKDRKSRRGVCKPCYSATKSARAKEASAEHDPSSVPYPAACITCGKGPTEVSYKWRADIKKGGWRANCNDCYNSTAYVEASRAKHALKIPLNTCANVLKLSKSGVLLIKTRSNELYFMIDGVLLLHELY